MMARWMVGAVACVALAVGCAQPMEEDTDDASGAISGTPGETADAVDAKKDLELRRAVFAAYRAAQSFRLTEMAGIACTGDAKGTRTFAIAAGKFDKSSSEETQAFIRLKTALASTRHYDTNLYVRQSPSSDGKLVVTFFANGYAFENGDIKNTFSCTKSSAVLTCKGVPVDGEITPAHCGL